jgi:hypothetical protein
VVEERFLLCRLNIAFSCDIRKVKQASLVENARQFSRVCAWTCSSMVVVVGRKNKVVSISLQRRQIWYGTKKQVCNGFVQLCYGRGEVTKSSECSTDFDQLDDGLREVE